MLECLIIGDSIAEGVFQHRQDHYCVSYAHVGRNSKQFNHVYRNYNLDANTVVISLGTNDNRTVDTYEELSNLRERIHAKRVFWILPKAVNPASGTDIRVVQTSIESIAAAYGDYILTIPQPMADRYHPTVVGYKQLVKEIK